MSSAMFETSLTHQKRRASWNWYNLFIYCDATRDNSKFKLFQEPNLQKHPYDYSHHPFSTHIAHLTIVSVTTLIEIAV
jgi:hypothetical protein